MAEIKTCEQYVLSELESLKLENAHMQMRLNDLNRANDVARSQLESMQRENACLQNKIAELEISHERIRIAVTNMLLDLKDDSVTSTLSGDDYATLSKFAKGE